MGDAPRGVIPLLDGVREAPVEPDLDVTITVGGVAGHVGSYAAADGRQAVDRLPEFLREIARLMDLLNRKAGAEHGLPALRAGERAAPHRALPLLPALAAEPHLTPLVSPDPPHTEIHGRPNVRRLRDGQAAHEGGQGGDG